MAAAQSHVRLYPCLMDLTSTDGLGTSAAALEMKCVGLGVSCRRLTTLLLHTVSSWRNVAAPKAEAT
jgi:hypothetical protein